RDLYEASLREEPRNVEAALGRCESWIDDGAPAEALRDLEPLLAGGTPDAWLLSAAAAHAFGEIPTARLFACNAREAARTKPWIGAWRRARLGELLGALGASAGPGGTD